MREMKRQLRTLGEWQKSLLPRVLPQIDGWDIAAHYAVGAWPGGDYYDLMKLPDGRLLVMVADASDQGGPSAALVAMVRVMLHSCPLSSGVERLPFCPMQGMVIQPPQVLLGHLNHILVENSLEEQFLTAFCAVLDPVDGNLHFANAGHPAPRWWHAGRRELEAIRDPAGLPLGIDHRATYHHKRVVLEPGDLLVLYSDGLTTAQNEDGLMYGSERLDTVIRATADEGADSVRSALLVSMDDFLNGVELNDDVTILILERLH